MYAQSVNIKMKLGHFLSSSTLAQAQTVEFGGQWVNVFLHSRYSLGELISVPSQLLLLSFSKAIVHLIVSVELRERES